MQGKGGSSACRDNLFLAMESTLPASDLANLSNFPPSPPPVFSCTSVFMGEEAMGEEAIHERELRRGDFPLRRGEFFGGGMFAFPSTDLSALPIQRVRPPLLTGREKTESNFFLRNKNKIPKKLGETKQKTILAQRVLLVELMRNFCACCSCMPIVMLALWLDNCQRSRLNSVLLDLLVWVISRVLLG